MNTHSEDMGVPLENPSHEAPKTPEVIGTQENPKEHEPLLKKREFGLSTQEMLELFGADSEKVVAQSIEKTIGAEGKAAKKIENSLGSLAETVKDFVGSFVEKNYVITGAQDLVHDTTQAVAGTKTTNWVKKASVWFFGKQNKETPPEEAHRGFADVPSAVLNATHEIPAKFLEGIVNIPSTLAKKFNSWSEETLTEQDNVAKEHEARALALYTELSESVYKEKDAIYRAGLSPENTARINELQDAEKNAGNDHKETAVRARETDVGSFKNKTKIFFHSGTTAALDFLSYTVGMGGVIEEGAKAFGEGVRGARRERFAERTGNAPFSRDVLSSSSSEEKVLSTMERLGDVMMSKAIALKELRDDFAHELQEEVSLVQKKDVAIFQDVIAQRIDALAKQAKPTRATWEEIAQLNTKLTQARDGSLATEEIHILIERAKSLVKKEDVKVLSEYILNQAVSTINGLDALPEQMRAVLTADLKKSPMLVSRSEHGAKTFDSPLIASLRTAETAIYDVLVGYTLTEAGSALSPEQQAQLKAAHDTLRERADSLTRTYTADVAKISADIVKGLQAASREVKKVAVTQEASGG